MTNLLPSPIGLGLAALGRPGYINLGHADDLGRDYDVMAMQLHTHAVLDAAWHAGVRYFDAARSYGRAEEFLGTWLRTRQIPPEMVSVGSKWGYAYTAGWQVHATAHEIKEHTLTQLRRQWPETQAHLGGYLRLYQIHSATLESGVLEDPAVLSALAALKRQGIAVGLSLSGPGQAATLERACAIEIDGVRLFDSAQATWSVLEISAGSALERAHATGMQIIIKEALANGRLTARNTEASFAAKRAFLDVQAKRLHTTIDALALAAALAQPWAGLVLSGAATVAQLDSNIRALDVALDVEAKTALAAMAEPAELYWATRKGLAWN
jgi:aryl-alcohol dehydrogenase-like predicted oxidoreductase